MGPPPIGDPPLRRTANGSGKLKRRAEVLSASRRALNGGSATKSKLLIGKRAYPEAEQLAEIVARP